jgi:hypothetical protein
MRIKIVTGRRPSRSERWPKNIVPKKTPANCIQGIAKMINCAWRPQNQLNSMTAEWNAAFSNSKSLSLQAKKSAQFFENALVEFVVHRHLGV